MSHGLCGSAHCFQSGPSYAHLDVIVDYRPIAARSGRGRFDFAANGLGVARDSGSSKLAPPAPELVASGVENMQIRYGVFQANSSVRYMAANEMAATDWDIVQSVQIWLLMRSERVDPGYQNNTTYTMGTQNIAVNDGFRRMLLRAVVELRN